MQTASLEDALQHAVCGTSAELKVEKLAGPDYWLASVIQVAAVHSGA